MIVSTSGRQSGGRLPSRRGRVDDDALHGGRRVVAFVAGGFAVVVLGEDDRAGIRIEEELFAIEAKADLGDAGAVDAVAVELAGFHAVDEDVPVVVGAVGRRVDADRSRGLGVVLMIEEQELDGGGTRE